MEPVPLSLCAPHSGNACSLLVATQGVHFGYLKELATSRGGYQPGRTGNCSTTDRFCAVQQTSLHTRQDTGKAMLWLKLPRQFCQKVGLRRHSLDVKLRFYRLCRVKVGFLQAFRCNQLGSSGGEVVRFRVVSTRSMRSCPACCEDGPLLLALGTVRLIKARRGVQPMHAKA